MDNPTKNSILKTVEQKFRLGEVVLVVSFINFGNSIKFAITKKNSQIFEAYQVVGAEHQNRLLAIVKSGNSSALFSFNVLNYPPNLLSDLNIEAVFPINETFLIDNSSGYGISSHQFQVLSGNEQILYYYYPDEQTCRSKEIFEKILKKLIQGEISELMSHDTSSNMFCRFRIFRRKSLRLSMGRNLPTFRLNRY